MKINPKVVVVAGVGLATLAFLWWEHRTPAATSNSDATGPLGAAPVAKPKARARRTVSNSPVVDVSAPEEPFTQLQLESAGALGAGGASADGGDLSVSLKEDLNYLGLGDS
jgi:hypothetical protein